MSVSLVEINHGLNNIVIEKTIALSDKVAALDALHRISIAMSSTLDLGELLQFIVDEAANQLNTQSCSILLPDQKTDDMVFHAAIDSIVGMSVPAGKGIASRVFHTGTPEIINDVSSDSDYYSKIEEDSAKPVYELLAIPLLVNGKTIGVLEMINKRDGIFTEQDRDFMMIMASHASVAIENARLVNQQHEHEIYLKKCVVEQTAELRELYEQVKILAVTDELTGLFNRRGLFDLGEREINRFRRFGNALSAILLDLDHFKHVNDKYGHVIGDQVLKTAAQRCKDGIRDVDIIGRYGGEEFAILLPETGNGEACQLAERLRRCIAKQPVYTDKGNVPITISLGVALAAGDEDLSILLNKADEAMYLAKQSGRNCVVNR